MYVWLPCMPYFSLPAAELNYIYSQSIGFRYSNTNGFFKKTSKAYARTARPVVPKIFWARPKSNFGEHLV